MHRSRRMSWILNQKNSIEPLALQILAYRTPVLKFVQRTSVKNETANAFLRFITN